MPIFKVDTNAGDNWLIAAFGADDDGESYYLTTDHIHASELYIFSDDAKADAELVCRLLNEYYQSDEGKKLIAERAGQLPLIEVGPC